jgi:hypothetical protein
MPFCSVTVKLNNKHGANNEGIAVGDMNLTFKCNLDITSSALCFLNVLYPGLGKYLYENCIHGIDKKTIVFYAI